MKCTICDSEAIIEIRYSGSSLCRDHFVDFFERRVKKEIRDQVRLTQRKGTIAVALSGGKDSSVTLYVLKKFLGPWRYLRIVAFTVDEGIAGYRPKGIESARKLCESLGIEHRIKAFTEIVGNTMDEIVSMDPKGIPCSYCGPARRHAMNDASLDYDADYVALGINLDDYAQSILMNVAKGDVQRMSRLAPHHTRVEGMIPRIVPLRSIPEREVLTYAIINKIPFDSSWCPYYERAHRNSFRDVISILEERSPGTRHAIMNFLDGILPALRMVSGEFSPKKCKGCGRVSSWDYCSLCKEMDRLRKGAAEPTESY